MSVLIDSFPTGPSSRSLDIVAKVRLLNRFLKGIGLYKEVAKYGT